MEWIKLEDRLPEIGEKVLVCVRKYSDFSKCDMDTYHIAHYWEDGWFCPYEDGKQVEPIFWMSIPNAPK